MACGDADINLCPPGGKRVLNKLAILLNKDPSQYQLEIKPLRIAVINEDLCIGCTKCIQACPVDAITGAAKLMHTVINTECTGCNLCVEPCPMDCIDMLPVNEIFSDLELQTKSDHARLRFQFRNARLERDEIEHQQTHQQAKLINNDNPIDAKKAAIAAAVARANAKRAANDPK